MEMDSAGRVMGRAVPIYNQRPRYNAGLDFVELFNGKIQY